jgi:membrane fusion protein, copper/silver efflux system
MIMRKNQLIIWLLCLGSMAWVACGQSGTENTTRQQETAKAKAAIDVPDNFQSQLDNTVKAYLSLKNALVASDTTQASAKAGDLLASLNQVDSASLSGEVARKWSGYKNSLSRAAQTVQASQKLDEQRLRFEDLSAAMYAMVNDFGSQTTLYKQYCPMAFDDKGAFWLSAQSEIKNPYFGDAMLTCGEVQETLAFE